MPKTGIAAFATEIGEQIAAKSIHATCLVIFLVPVPFILYYVINLKLLDGNLILLRQEIASSGVTFRATLREHFLGETGHER